MTEATALTSDEERSRSPVPEGMNRTFSNETSKPCADEGLQKALDTVQAHLERRLHESWATGRTLESTEARIRESSEPAVVSPVSAQGRMYLKTPQAASRRGQRASSLSPDVTRRPANATSLATAQQVPESASRVDDSGLNRHSVHVADAHAQKCRSLYDNVDPGLLHEYSEKDVNCFGNFGCGLARYSRFMLASGTNGGKSPRLISKFVKEKISPLFRMATSCTSVSSGLGLSKGRRADRSPRSTSVDDLHRLGTDRDSNFSDHDVFTDEYGRFFIESGRTAEH